MKGLLRPLRTIQSVPHRLQGALDAFAMKTGICVIRHRLKHPGRKGDVTLSVPGYRQIESYTCGFAAGLMVLHAFHPTADIDTFYRRIRPTPRYGASTRKLADALRRSGVGVSVRKGLGFNEIRQEIDAGFPILTCLKTQDDAVEHWVAIYGYGLKPNRIFLAGNGLPFLDAREMFWDDYLKKAGSGRVGLVCWGKRAAACKRK